MSLINGRMSPTHRRIMQLLGDGMGHSRKELLGCLNDDQAGNSAVDFHISTLRKVVAEKHMDIICREGCYRLVRYITPND